MAMCDIASSDLRRRKHLLSNVFVVTDDTSVNGSGSESGSESARVSVQSTLGKEEINETSDSSNKNDHELTLTLGSDGKPKRRNSNNCYI